MPTQPPTRKMPQPLKTQNSGKKTQNAVPPKTPKSSDLKAPIVRRPPTPPKLRREEAFVRQEASDTESDSEPDVTEEMRHNVEFHQHLSRNAVRQQHVHDGSCCSQRRQHLCFTVDRNGSTGPNKWHTGGTTRLSNADFKHMLHERFERDHHDLDQQRSAMDVEKNLL